MPKSIINQMEKNVCTQHHMVNRIALWVKQVKKWQADHGLDFGSIDEIKKK